MTPSSERLLVAGASGLVGAELARVAEAAGYSVLGVARRVRGCASRSVDLSDRAQIEAALAEFNPDLFAVCSAFAHVDACEREPLRSWKENVDTVANVVRATQGSRVKVLFFSTDQVFDGTKPFFVESDPVRPLNVYARHKVEAERLLLERGLALVIRSSWLFGRELDQKNFMYRVISACRKGERLVLPIQQAGCPTWVGWLAASTLSLLNSGVEGIVHLSGNELLTKAEWARLLVTTLKLPGCEMREVPWQEAGQIAPRPEQVALRSKRHSLLPPKLSAVLQAEQGDFIG